MHCGAEVTESSTNKQHQPRRADEARGAEVQRLLGAGLGDARAHPHRDLRDKPRAGRVVSRVAHVEGNPAPDAAAASR